MKSNEIQYPTKCESFVGLIFSRTILKRYSRVANPPQEIEFPSVAQFTKCIISFRA